MQDDKNNNIRRFLIASASFLALSPAFGEQPGSEAQPLSKIVESLERQGYTPIVEVDYDAGRWEIEAYRNGAKYEIHVDPKTGEILSQRPDEDGPR